MASADYKGIVDFAQAIDDTYVRKDAPSVPVGGAKGEVLRKKSSTDGDAEWANPLYHFSTLAQMQAALALGQIPDGANVSVEEEQPGGNTGDTSLDTTSENWVQNKVVATAVNQLSSELTSLITTQDYDFTGISFSADAIGTRGYQSSVNLGSGLKKVLATNIIYIEDSSKIIPVAFYSKQSDALYLNIYRAVSYAMSSNKVTVRVTWLNA